MKSMLMMKDITKSFTQGKEEIHALKKINLDVKQGEFISIIGPSGSGKSTFLT
ncbi:MAG: ATP-binding cassette domain-containing protein, partial [Vagococcus sp.]